jgi:hypothetical protein
VLMRRLSPDRWFDYPGGPGLALINDPCIITKTLARA